MAAFDVDSMMSRLLNVGMAGGRLTTQVSEQELQVSWILVDFWVFDDSTSNSSLITPISAIVSTRQGDFHQPKLVDWGGCAIDCLW